MIFGADGFIGSNVCAALAGSHVLGLTSRYGSTESMYVVDLLNQPTIETALEDFKPEVIINCAGVVGPGDAVDNNQAFTENILKAILKVGRAPKRIIISGSAAEYGEVQSLPVNEDTPLNATSSYGMSKVKETTLALAFKKDYGLPVVVARIFNPIGVGMREKFLIQQLVKQVSEIELGKRETAEVGRLDALRDYIDVRDVADAVKKLIECDLRHEVYNIGSGICTSNSELIEMVLNSSGLEKKPNVRETALEPEPLFAAQADISRIQDELGWRPVRTLENTIKEIIHAAGI